VSVSPEIAFRVLNAVVLPWWALWLVAPRSALAQRFASHAGIFVALCGAYAVLLAATFAGGGASGGLGFEGLRAALGTPVGFLAGWTHYLVFDLFVGAWMLREARRLDVEVRPFLLFGLLAGPLGLGAFLLRRAARLRSFGGVGATDLV
jgi:hypothetical protein